MLEIFDILRHSENSSLTSTSGENPILDSVPGDRIFKTITLVFLIFSMMIQILIFSWFHNKLKIVENRLSLYSIDKPEKVDLTVILPELVKTDRKIDLLTRQLDKALKSQRVFLVPEENTKTEFLPIPIRKEAESRRSIQVEVIEEVKN